MDSSCYEMTVCGQYGDQNTTFLGILSLSSPTSLHCAFPCAMGPADSQHLLKKSWVVVAEVREGVGAKGEQAASAVKAQTG